MSGMRNRTGRAAWLLALVWLSGTAELWGKPDALEFGQRYAEAITADRHDRNKAYERVALAYVARGEVDRALACAERMDNWRQVVVLAQAAGSFAEQGLTNQAWETVTRAEEAARDETEWRADRAQVVLAETRALLGDTGTVQRVAGAYAEDSEYRGRVAAAYALSLARSDRGAEAMAWLEQVPVSNSYDVALWRAEGFRRLAEAGRVDAVRAGVALQQGWEATSAIKGWKRLTVQMDLAHAQAKIGDGEAARAWMSAVTSNLLDVKRDGHIQGPLLGQAAVSWAKLGRAEEARACVVAADAVVTEAGSMQDIERPEVLALMGQACALAGDEAEARRHFTRAVDVAAALVNGRPRALAGIDICLALEGAGARGPDMTASLESLRDTFEMPGPQ